MSLTCVKVAIQCQYLAYYAFIIALRSVFPFQIIIYITISCFGQQASISQVACDSHAANSVWQSRLWNSNNYVVCSSKEERKRPNIDNNNWTKPTWKHTGEIFVFFCFEVYLPQSCFYLGHQCWFLLSLFLAWDVFFKPCPTCKCSNCTLLIVFLNGVESVHVARSYMFST